LILRSTSLIWPSELLVQRNPYQKQMNKKLHNSKFLVRYSAVLRISAIGANLKNPLPLETGPELVIPAKSRKAGREPGSRKNQTILQSHWIPDIRHRRIPE
jgi:hypothetical protein